MKRWTRGVLMALAVMVLLWVWLGPVGQRFLAEDACLDAGGGIRPGTDVCEMDPPGKSYRLP